MDDTKTVTYDVTILKDFTEVTRSDRETLLYNKYFPEFSRRFSDRMIYPGAYRFVVTEDSNGDVISMTYEKVVYPLWVRLPAILMSYFTKR